MKKIWFKLLLFDFLVSFIATCLVLTGGGFLGNAQAAESKELLIRSAGGVRADADKESFYDPFTKETGIKVISVDIPLTDVWGKLAAQIKSNNVELDLVHGQTYGPTKAAFDKGLLDKIDYKIVTDTKDLVPGAVREWGLGQEINSILIGYNYKIFSRDNYPRSWADFWDVNKFPGPRAMNNIGAEMYNLFVALLADGVPPNRLIPIDFDRAFKKLDQIKPHIKLWYSTGGQLTQALQSGEVVMGQLLDGRAKVAIRLGAPFKLEFNQGFLIQCYYGVVKGAPHKDAAMQFLNSICRPERQGKWADKIGYSSANSKFIEYLPPDKQKEYSVHPDNFEKQIKLTAEKDLDWMAKNEAMTTERWNAWLSK